MIAEEFSMIDDHHDHELQVLLAEMISVNIAKKKMRVVEIPIERKIRIVSSPQRPTIQLPSTRVQRKLTVSRSILRFLIQSNGYSDTHKKRAERIENAYCMSCVYVQSFSSDEGVSVGWKSVLALIETVRTK